MSKNEETTNIKDRIKEQLVEIVNTFQIKYGSERDIWDCIYIIKDTKYDDKYHIIFEKTKERIKDLELRNDLSYLKQRLYFKGSKEIIDIATTDLEIIENFITSLYIHFDFWINTKEENFEKKTNHFYEHTRLIEIVLGGNILNHFYFDEYLPLIKLLYLKQFEGSKKSINFKDTFNDIAENPYPGMKVLTLESDNKENK